MRGLDYKLTPKQQRLLEVISDTKHAKKTNLEKAKLAGVSDVYYYQCLRNPNFIQFVRIAGLSDVISITRPVIKRMAADALNGKFMQGRTMLEMGGLIGQSQQHQPLINVIINNAIQPQNDADRVILDKILDITPDINKLSTTQPIANKEDKG